MSVLKKTRVSRVLRMGVLAMVVPLLAACIETTANVGQRVTPGKAVKVALLVPSGSGSEQQNALATGLVNAAKLAVSDVKGAQIELKVYSTAGLSLIHI